MRLLNYLFCVIISINLMSCTSIEKPHSVKVKNGFVPNETTAITIAQAVLIPIYGKEKIEKQKPFKAKLENGIWIVSGTFNMPTEWKGGTAIAEISKKDGKIIRVSHGK